MSRRIGACLCFLAFCAAAHAQTPEKAWGPELTDEQIHAISKDIRARLEALQPAGQTVRAPRAERVKQIVEAIGKVPGVAFAFANEEQSVTIQLTDGTPIIITVEPDFDPSWAPPALPPGPAPTPAPTPAPAAGAEVTLKFKLAAGERWSFDEETTFKLAFDVLANGQVAQRVEKTNRAATKGDLTVLEVAGDRPSAVRARYAPGCGETEETAGEAPRTTPSGLAGQTVTVRRQAQGDALVECAAPLSDDEKQEARDLLEPTEGFLPKRPVKPGDRWVADERSVARELKLGAADRGTMRCRLKALRGVEGRRAAEIEVSLVIDKKEDFMAVTLDLEGTVLVDAETGIAVGVDIAGPATLSGETEKPGEDGKPVKISIDGTGECKLRRTARKLPNE